MITRLMHDVNNKIPYKSNPLKDLSIDYVPNAIFYSFKWYDLDVLKNGISR